MAVTMKELGIDRLSVEDRVALAQEIWDSTADAPDQLPLIREQRRESDRRIADLDANPDNVLTWEEIPARVRGRP